MDTTLVPNTPSQQTGEDLSVLVTETYLADRYTGIIITCNQTPDGAWPQMTVLEQGQRDV
jgi:hypothetical protein